MLLVHPLQRAFLGEKPRLHPAVRRVSEDTERKVAAHLEHVEVRASRVVGAGQDRVRVAVDDALGLLRVVAGALREVITRF